MNDMTHESATAVLATVDGYVDLDLAGGPDEPVILDGRFTTEQLQAIIFLKRNHL